MIIRGYKVELHRLKPDLGGGFVAYAPVLVGCVSDGVTREDALRQIDDAIECWLDAARSLRRDIPIPEDDLLYT
jgi:predicted RNase H-like HicB family nuclease